MFILLQDPDTSSMRKILPWISCRPPNSLIIAPHDTGTFHGAVCTPSISACWLLPIYAAYMNSISSQLNLRGDIYTVIHLTYSMASLDQISLFPLALLRLYNF